MATTTFNSSGSWTCPTGITVIQVECWGAGGDGDPGTTPLGGNGGGGGAYATAKTLVVVPGTAYTVTCGLASDSWFNTSSTVKAAKGATAAAGGAGGTVANCVGDVKTAGTAGASQDGSGGGGSGGSAASPNGGGGGAGGAIQLGGSPGTAPGGGGGGGGQGQTSGGTGAAGRVVITTSPAALTADPGTTAVPIPTILGSYIAGSTIVSVSGVPGGSVEIVRNGTSVGIVLLPMIKGGSASFGNLTLATALAQNDTLKARQWVSASVSPSAYTTTITVGASGGTPPAPTWYGGDILYAGLAKVSGNGALPGALVKAYVNGVFNAQAYALSSTEFSGADALWEVVLSTPLVAGNTVYVTQTFGGLTSANSATLTTIAAYSDEDFWVNKIMGYFADFSFPTDDATKARVRDVVKSVLISREPGGLHLPEDAIREYMGLNALNIARYILGLRGVFTFTFVKS